MLESLFNKVANVKVFSYEIWEFFKNTTFYRTPPVASPIIIKRQRCILDPVKNAWWDILWKLWTAKRISNFLRCTKRCLSLKIFKATVNKSADLKIYLLKKYFDGALVCEISSTIPTSKGNNMDFHFLHQFFKSRICPNIDKYHLTVSLKLLQRK